MDAIRAVATHEVDALLAFIIEQQADPATGTCYIGTTAEGIRLELDDLGDAWPGSALVATRGDRIVAAAVADVDEDLGRSWIYGPWAIPDAWDDYARALVDAVIERLPATVTAHEISADVANQRMAGLAKSLGWEPSVPNHVFVADLAATRAWPPPDPRVREVRPDDFEAIDRLHAAEFPNTYLSTRQMIDEAVAGSRMTMVSADRTGVIGYASGTVQADGAGYLDFVAITEAARGSGAGVGLASTIGRRIIAASPAQNLNLTVQQPRDSAVELYRNLGFRLETTIVGYSSPTA